MNLNYNFVRGIEICCGRHGIYNFDENIVGIDSINFHKRNFIHAVGEAIPIHKVDFAICCNGIDHCCNPEKVLEEMFRVAKVVVLWVYVYPWVISWFMQKSDKMHPYHFTTKTLQKLLSNNTKIIKQSNCSPLFYLKYSNSRKMKVKLIIAYMLRVKAVCLHLEKISGGKFYDL